MKIGIDIDNVVSDTVPVLLPTLNTIFASKLSPRDIYMYDFHSVLGISGKEMKDRFWDKKHGQVYIVEKLFKKAKPVRGAMDAIKLLQVRGHEIVFVTDRPSWCMRLTKEWLNKYGINGCKIIHIIGGMGGKHKYTEFLEVHGEGFDVFIEDKLEDAILIKENNPHARVFLLKRPWNRTMNVINSLILVSGWHEILKML